MVSVTIKFFGPAQALTGQTSTTMDVAEGETVGALAGRLAEQYPNLGAAVGLRLAVNRQYVPLDRKLLDGDEVAVIPPVSGGAPSTHAQSTNIRLSRDAIDPGSLLPSASGAAIGGACQFVGTVRTEARGAVSLVALDYEAYEEMALELMRAIRAKAIERFGINDAAIVHRLGRVPISEAAIVVATWSAHRAEAFESCRWIVDAVKTDVPIWKKDVWSDGSEAWTKPTE